MANIANVTVTRPAPQNSVASGTAEAGDLSVQVHNPTAFHSAAELAAAIKMAADHLSATLGLK